MHAHPPPPAKFTAFSTDITLSVRAHYKKSDDEKDTGQTPRYTPAYEADFKGIYLFCNDGKYPIRADLTFPFPPTVGTLTGVSVVQDEKPVKNVAYGMTEASWTTRFLPGKTVKLVVTYSARGEGSFMYDLPDNQRLDNLNFVIRFAGDGIQADALIFPDGTLKPDNTQTETDGSTRLFWQLENVLPKYNIGFVLPSKPTHAARLASLRPLITTSPLLLLAFLVLLALAAWMKDEHLSVWSWPFVGIAFYLFYILLVVLAKYLAIGWALGLSGGIIGIMTLLFLGNVSRPRFAWSTGLLLLLLAFVLVPEAQLHR